MKVDIVSMLIDHRGRAVRPRKSLDELAGHLLLLVLMVTSLCIPAYANYGGLGTALAVLYIIAPLYVISCSICLYALSHWSSLRRRMAFVLTTAVIVLLLLVTPYLIGDVRYIHFSPVPFLILIVPVTITFVIYDRYRAHRWCIQHERLCLVWMPIITNLVLFPICYVAIAIASDVCGRTIGIISRMVSL